MASPPAARLTLDPRDQRLVDGAARWMGMLGRFQVLLGGLVLLLEVGAALAYWLVDRLDDASHASETSPPLVTLGSVSSDTVALVAASVLLFGGITVRGGTLLIDAAEDFERYLQQKDADRLLHDGLARLGSYFLLESLLVGAALAGLLFAGARA
jgi:hypothetical protein